MTVTCAICGKNYELIAYLHLKKHGLNFNEYRKLYPEAELMDEKCKQKIRLDHIGKPFTKERCENISKSLIGKPLSEKHKQLLSKIRVGHKFPESRNKKMANSLRGIPKSDITKLRMSISAKKRTHLNGNTESIYHKNMKYFIEGVLADLGYYVSLEQYIDTKFNRYWIDVYAKRGSDELLFEVGKCKIQKLLDLQECFSQIFHIPYPKNGGFVYGLG